MTKKLTLFLVSASLLTGSFLGTYYFKKRGAPTEGPLMQAKVLINTAGGDQDKLAQASDLLRKELATDPDNFPALFLQARALQQRGLIDLALQSYDQYFARKVSSDFAAHYNAGELHELRGDLAKAEKNFQGCIAVAPEEPSGWERLITLLLRQNRIDEAKTYYKSLIQLSPSSDAVKRLSLTFPQ